MLGLGIFLCCTLVLGWYLHHRRYVWTNDAYIDGYQISISPDIEARITQLFVDEGDIVKKGQLLCQLDESILISQKADAMTYADAIAKQVLLQKIAMEKLRDIYRVALQEYETEIISYIEFDKIEKDFRYAEAQYKTAEANHVNAIAKLGVIEELLVHTRVLAPRDGAIAKRWVVAGDVSRFGQPLFALTDIEHIYITANLEEGKIEHLKPGNRVDIHVDAYPDRSFSGAVFVVRASAAGRFALIPPENATGNFTKVVQRIPIKILLDIPKTAEPLYLYPGMSVEVSIRIR
ncbi:MAG: HlyD family secretion protein [Chlamydiia bacterium]|nr:HlyD family secretion protein [Chlamydiia bacterium]